MIKLFQATDKDFSSNGDKIINTVKARIKKADNGDYSLSIEAGLEYADDLTAGAILVAPTPQGEQAFRISNPQKTRKKVTLTAKHVFYDSARFLIKDSYVVDKNCNDALAHLNAATDTASPFTTTSNIQTIDSYRCVRKSLNEAISAVLERWGGHLVRDNYNIQILAEIGQDNGVTVRYRKNLQDITCAEKWDNVVTKLLPTGADGIMLNALDSSIDPYIYAAVDYGIPYTKTVAFSQSIDQEQYKGADGKVNEVAYKTALLEDLRQQAQVYIDTYSIPEINYTLKADLPKITDIGDIIEVIDERLHIDLLTSVISYEYDCIARRYTQLEFGNFKSKLSNLIENITNNVTQSVAINSSTTTANLEAQIQATQAQINSVLGDSYVIYDGDKILVVDRLPKEAAQNVIRINNGGLAFSQSGINGNFTSAWAIDGTLNMQAINVINFAADLIKGGTLKLGANLNESGELKLFDDANNLIGEMNSSGLKMYGQDGGYIVLNNAVGLAGYDRLGNKTYWIDKDEFHMKKSVVEQEITLCGKVRFIPITLTDNGGNVTSDGIGLVSVAGGI